MIEPLVVEPSRLETAGNTLRDLPFPVPPAPIVAPGTDAVSAAVNATLPIIESPVTSGLPAVKAALAKTGSSIAAAAGMYSDTDQRLIDHLDQVQFLSAAQAPAGGTPAENPEGTSPEKPAGDPAGKPADGKKPTGAKPTPQPAAPQLDQLAGAAGALGPVMQTMQGAMGSLQGMQGAGATPAQLADSNKSDRSPDDEARLVDEHKTDEEVSPEARAEGAAPGTETSQNAPVAPTKVHPEAAPAKITL
ncbi:hypothetical protein [Mycobacterium montefiorense]|uniref:hypothetical protein n=1 Tax=Mycobacterium montefiorense TaxID=154654 RepID=UPI0021DC9256|nr:hypothetical protein [Mycobacterium montefiorense]MCV7429642.1 hypothetical protein [Mycobacterium montefiorense]GLE52938.1 hypothetical protein ATCCBAA256_24950 [Mycobacterium montefiorense]